MILCYLAFFMALGYIKSFFPELDFNQYQQSELNKLVSENPWKLVFLVLILAPAIEECFFRSLVKPSQNDLIIFLCAFLTVFASFFIPANIYWLLKYAFLALFILLMFLFLKEVIPHKTQRKSLYFLNKNYRIVWILSAFIFGLVHIFNYVDVFQINLVLFLLVFPRMIAGYFLGKIKIENGSLLWSILFHAMNNITVLFLIFPKIFPTL